MNGNLVLKRKEGDWTEVEDISSPGKGFRIRVQDIDFKSGKVNLVFEDPNKYYSFERPERARKDKAKS
jgi:hypothetical protein